MYEITCLDKNGKSVTHLTQWDINQSLVIKGLGVKSSPEFHFCNKKSNEALVVSSTLNTLKDTLTVKIPNKLLEEPYPIFVYIYYYSESNSAKTIAEIKLPIRQRAKPSDYEYVENIDYVTAESIKVDILNSVNNLSLKYEETEEDNYKISLYNLDGLEITNCELPISDIVEGITNQINNFTLKSEKLDTNDYRVTLYNSDNIEVTHCDVMTSEIIADFEIKNAEIVLKHDEDIQEIENSITEVNDKIVEINNQISNGNTYDFYTNFMLELNPSYSLYSEKKSNFSGSSTSIDTSNYNPYNGDTLIVWVDYQMIKMDVDYYIMGIGSGGYSINFENSINSKDVILQVWYKPKNIIRLPNVNILKYYPYATTLYDKTMITTDEYVADISKGISIIRLYANYGDVSNTNIKFRIEWDNGINTELDEYIMGSNLILENLFTDMDTTPTNFKVSLLLEGVSETDVDMELLKSFYIECEKVIQ